MYLFLGKGADFIPSFEICPLKLGSLFQFWIVQQVVKVIYEQSELSLSGTDKVDCNIIPPILQAIDYKHGNSEMVH